ncbi:MAG TPA: hypothetical protein DDW52_24370 [Planctomycetaceae bacterium]|nr:hypothetical protein [Planctomycetaceae bacterium]
MQEKSTDDGLIQAVWQVARFEAARTFTFGRIAIWLALIALPTVLIATTQLQSRGQIPETGLLMTAYVLVVQVGCMMGLVLWATPAVGGEVESQTWVYIAMRPWGRVAVVLGKYIVAVGWTLSASIPSAIGVSLLIGSQGLVTLVWMVALVFLSTVAYAALYMLIGVVFSRRATVFSVIYSLIVEGAVSGIPAAICEITVSYRLRSLLVEWSGNSELQATAQQIYGSVSPPIHIAVILAYSALLLSIATVVVHVKEYAIEANNAV